MNTQCHFSDIRKPVGGPHHTIKVVELPAVPLVGEKVNIAGNRYRVLDRTWAICEDGSLTCYLQIERRITTR